MLKEGENLYSFHLIIPQGMDISWFTFVLYFPHNHSWDNNHSQNYAFPVNLNHPPMVNTYQGKKLDFQSLLSQIVEQEKRPHWEMGLRLTFIGDSLQKISPDEANLTLIDLYLALAAQGHLPWRRNYDRQTYVVAPKIEGLARQIAQGCSSFSQYKRIWRQMLKSLPSSGRNLKDIGSAIRLKILECKDHQQRHIYDQFMYEFHQKLHNASGPEDIAIARAYLSFLEAKGQLNPYYLTLLQAGLAEVRKTQAQETIIPLLDQYGDNRAIHSLPTYDQKKAESTKKIISELLELLKKFYQGLELTEAIDKMDKISSFAIQDKSKICLELLARKKELDEQFNCSTAEIMLKTLSDLRHHLHSLIQPKAGEELLDILLLDLSFEDYAKALVNALCTCRESTGKKDRIEPIEPNQFSLLITCLAHSSLADLDDPELVPVLQHLELWSKDHDQTPDWLLQGKAILDRLGRLLGSQMDRWMDLYQPVAEVLGQSLGLEPQVWRGVVEEQLRASWLFLLSRLLTHLRQSLRLQAGLPRQEILIPGKVQGIVIEQKKLSHLSPGLSHLSPGRTGQPVIVLLESLQGDEDIPQDIVGLITKIQRDIMSHFGIRAREQGVVWICLEEDLDFQKLRSLSGQWVELAADEEQFHLTIAKEPDSGVSSPIPKIITLPKVDMVRDLTILTLDQFIPSLVGPKAYNLKLLTDRLSPEVRVPDACAIPFGTFELILEKNPKQAKEFNQLTADLLQKMSQGNIFHPNTITLNSNPNLNSNSNSNLNLNTNPKNNNMIDQEAYFQQQLESIRNIIEDLAIDQSYLQKLEESVQTRLGCDTLILRSSSNAEDLPDYSGAGLFSSYAGVALNQIAQFLKKVWASKWMERAVLNQQKYGLNSHSVHLAVLINRLIPGDYAFVVHTRHPIKRTDDLMYIELVQGLGESLVSGSEGKGYRFTFDKKTEEIRRIGLADKGYRWIISPDGQTKREFTDYRHDRLAGNQNLWEPLIRKIGLSACMIEKSWHQQAQDIEGVIKDEEVYIVQTRPQI